MGRVHYHTISPSDTAQNSIILVAKVIEAKKESLPVCNTEFPFKVFYCEVIQVLKNHNTSIKLISSKNKIQMEPGSVITITIANVSSQLSQFIDRQEKGITRSPIYTKMADGEDITVGQNQILLICPQDEKFSQFRLSCLDSCLPLSDLDKLKM